MNIPEYEAMYRSEKDHWWFRAKRDIVLHILQKYVRRDKSVHGMDFGCGTGALLEELSSRYENVEGIDVSPEAAKHCALRGLHNVQVIDGSWQLPQARYSFIVASDVLEHIEDDVATLRQLWGGIKPGGVLLLTVPAYQFLWSSHDEALHHKRRYTVPLLTQRAQEAGFRWEYISYYNAWLFPLALLSRMTQKVLPRKYNADTDKVPHWAVNEALYHIFRSEKHVLRKTKFPVGLSIIAIARKI